MKKELFGIGRTWIMALVLVVLATIMLYVGKIDATLWQNMILFAFGGGAAKSIFIGTTSVLKEKKE